MAEGQPPVGLARLRWQSGPASPVTPCRGSRNRERCEPRTNLHAHRHLTRRNRAPECADVMMNLMAGSSSPPHRPPSTAEWHPLRRREARRRDVPVRPGGLIGERRLCRECYKAVGWRVEDGPNRSPIPNPGGWKGTLLVRWPSPAVWPASVAFAMRLVEPEPGGPD